MDTPTTAVWEITMGCNMRCKHCGSSCTTVLPGQLTTEESLALCEDIAALKMQWVTLSGGEPLIRKDWPLLVARLRDLGVIPNMISNGWLCDEDVIETAKQAGIGTLALSLDGPRDVHDAVRKKGSHARVIKALRIMRDKGVSGGVITTVHRLNIDRLADLHEELLEVGLKSWQLQIGLPMGNLSKEEATMLLPPEAVNDVLDFIHARSDDPRMTIYPADCLGYFSRTEIESRTRAYRSETPITWMGCNAGKRSLGILHNGDILGCTSIRDREFIEGNIRQRPLAEIWNDPKSFAWSRGLTKHHLDGRCKTCGYGDTCLGGCPNTRLTVNGTIYSGNAYCAYSIGLDTAERALNTVEAPGRLRNMATNFMRTGDYQLAAMTLERLLDYAPDDVEALSAYGFASYSLNNLETARDANERVLRIDPGHVYATKGLGVVLHAMGQSEAGIACLLQAVEMTDQTDMDSYHDLAVVYLETDRKDDARDLLDRARSLSPDFATMNTALYQAVQ